MQRKDLEQFIHNHRDAFDDARPSLKLWAEIEKELDGPEAKSPKVRQMRTRRPWYQVAAAIAVLLTLGGFGGAYLSQQQSGPTAQEMIDEIAPDFAEMERYYNEQIATNYARLTAYTQDPEIDADLAQMDKAMAELRADLADAPPGREAFIINELMESYRLKLDILQRILDRIETNGNISKPNNANNNETSI